MKKFETLCKNCDGRLDRSLCNRRRGLPRLSSRTARSLEAAATATSSASVPRRSKAPRREFGNCLPIRVQSTSNAHRAFILKQGADGIPVADVGRRAGVSPAT